MRLNKKQNYIFLLGFFVIIGATLLLYYSNRPRNLNVILITIDALRPDHLGCYGYKRNTSPNIDKLAKEGIIFTQAISQSCWTWPSIHSLITSTYPSTHGVYFWDQELPNSIPALTQILKEKDYYTGFISGHGGLSNFKRGFNFFQDISGMKAEEITRKAISLIGKNKNRRFFLWLHYMETHSKSYCSLPIEGRSEKDMSMKEIRDYCLKYDAAISKVDNQLKTLLEKLRDFKIYKNSFIFITSDHGEEMGEHLWYFTHGGVLWDSLLKVPLILSCPVLFKNGRTINQQVRHIDIVPTILGILKIKKDNSMEGRSFLPLINNFIKNALYAFSEVKENMEDEKGNPYISNSKWNYTQFSVRGNGYKLILTLNNNGKEYALYNLKTDPKELNNCVNVEKRQFELLKSKLNEWMNRPKPNMASLTKPLDEETKKRLRGLGYLQ